MALANWHRATINGAQHYANLRESAFRYGLARRNLPKKRAGPRHWQSGKPKLEMRPNAPGQPPRPVRPKIIYQLATDLLNMSVIILSVVRRTVPGSLFIVAMFWVPRKSSKF